MATFPLHSDYAPAVSDRLAEFPDADAASLAQWLKENPVGTNLALKLLEQLADLAKKEGCPAATFLAEVPVGPELQAKERGRGWRERLEARLHPHQRAHARAFAAHVRELRLPSGAELEAPQGFEGRNFTLKLGFSDLGELEALLEGIRGSLAKRDWAGLWNY